MGAVQALNNANIMAVMINASDGTPPLALPVRATGITVIPAHNSLAGRCPVDTVTNVLNGATNNNNPIVLPDINISQVIYWFKRNYPTVVREQQKLIFGILTQGSDSLKIKRLGLNKPLNDELIETLEEIKMERNNLLLDEDIYNQLATKLKPKTLSYQNITTENIDKIKNITKADLQSSIKSLQKTISRATKILGNSKKSANKKAEDLIIRRFLGNILKEKGNVASNDDYNYDSVDNITDSMASMTLNRATINAIKSAVRSAVKKCIKCDSSPVVSKQVVKIKFHFSASSQNNVSSSSNNLISDES
ncbi:15467_t:CDS:2, partial [Funneliformis mosseae]